MKTAQVAACLKTIKRVRLENLELKNVVKLLTTQLVETDQFSWGNCVEIYRVPDIVNILQMVKQIGSAVKFMIEDGMVDVCRHQLGKNKSKQYRRPGIIVKFVMRFDKQRLLEFKKLNKPELSTRHIGMA